MVRYFAASIALVAGLAGSAEACNVINGEVHYSLALSAGEATSNHYCFHARVPAYHIGVVTLKHRRGQGDFDLRLASAISSFGGALPGSEIAFDNQGGTGSELALFEPGSSERYVYVKVFSDNQAAGDYEFYYHTINLPQHMAVAALDAGMRLLGQALAESFIESMTGRKVSRDERAVTAALVNGGISALQGSNLSGIAMDAVINAFLADAEAEFGPGSLAFQYVTSLVPNVVGDIYRHRGFF